MATTNVTPNALSTRENIVGTHSIRAGARLVLPDLSGGTVTAAQLNVSCARYGGGSNNASPVDTYFQDLTDISTDWATVESGLSLGTPIENNATFSASYTGAHDVTSAVQAAYTAGRPGMAALFNLDNGVTTLSSGYSWLRVGEIDESEFSISVALDITYVPAGASAPDTVGCGPAFIV